MLWSGISRVLGVSFAALAVFALSQVLLALLTGEAQMVARFGFVLVLMSFLAAAISVQVRTGATGPGTFGGFRNIILLLLTWWLVLPFFAGVPFLLDGYKLVDSWFESVSALTTTGAWLSVEEATGSSAMMLWRAQLQWLGGLVSLAAIATVFIRPDFVGVENATALFSRREGETYVDSFFATLRGFLPVYLALTAVIFGILLASYAPPVESATMAMSLMASGGFLPTEDGAQSYFLSTQVVIFFAMLLSGINFLAIRNTFGRQQKNFSFARDRETQAFLLCALVAMGVFALSAGSEDFGQLSPQFFNAVSVLSTNGVIIGSEPALVAVLVVAVIGGASISTAGGLKLLRWLATMERTGQEVWMLIHPRGVPDRQKAANELAIWIHYMCFAILLAILVLLITAFGHPLETSMTAAVATLTNAGPLLTLVSDRADYQIFDPILRIIMGCTMIVGRLETVAALVLLNRYFWKG
ncbi:potassium transporter TrkG [Parvularcula sp. IMCC14364]|uniref:potassium transporter TrkG n=1 Tax=Parvularcula sp. IMCC14364 TaxID=3067902 RepID=UPI0027415889|nr:potassium transporter TrkG [Parvularcula sp. IMCC14364]